MIVVDLIFIIFLLSWAILTLIVFSRATKADTTLDSMFQIHNAISRLNEARNHEIEVHLLCDDVWSVIQDDDARNLADDEITELDINALYYGVLKPTSETKQSIESHVNCSPISLTNRTLYSALFGLPETTKSLDYYQILSIQRFSEDVQLIKHAMIDRNQLFLKWQNSDHYEDIKLLQSQLGQAFVTLLNPAKKAAYDQELRMILSMEA